MISIVCVPNIALKTRMLSSLSWQFDLFGVFTCAYNKQANPNIDMLALKMIGLFALHDRLRVVIILQQIFCLYSKIRTNIPDILNSSQYFAGRTHEVCYNIAYVVRGYKSSISDNPNYIPIGNDYSGTITADAGGETQDIKETIQKSVDANSSYKFELILRISSSREVLLSTLEFTTEGPINILSSTEDLVKIMRNPYGRFIVTADTAYPGFQVLFNTSVPFMGVLDFQGHTYTSTDNYLFNAIGTTGVVKNMVLDYTRTFTGYGTDRYALVYMNYGKIKDIYINYATTHVMDFKSGVWDGCGLIYYNMSSGVLENFVINLRKDYISGYWSTLGVRYNHGTVRNGYICTYNGSMIKAMRNYLNLWIMS